MQTTYIWILLIGMLITCITTVVTCVIVMRQQPDHHQQDTQDILYELEQLEKALFDELRGMRQELSQTVLRTVNALGQSLSAGQERSTRDAALRQDSLQKTVMELMRSIDGRFQGFTVQSEQQLAGIRASVEGRLSALQEDNHRQLGMIQSTVDEKLQKTLESRIGQSFQLVSERLEQVYRGLGEMQQLAVGVGDLRKVLSNVKTRGVLGEVQLGAILSQLLAPEQYCANVPTKGGSRNFVEYAVRLPGGDQPVWLPIDAKFPLDAYTQLTNAYDTGDKEAITAASNQLCARLRSFARDVQEKYIDPPNTTDFAILFLPFEGLYAQALQLGMFEPLMREYKVSLAGPTTLAALLNSLQMGFKTLAIQKRSGEVWRVLGAVRTEFERFGDTLGAAQQRLEQAGNELDKLVGVRTRMIQRRLAQVSSLEPDEAQGLLSE